MVLGKILESLLDCREIKPVNPKGNQSWIFIGRTEAEAPVLWPPDVKNWLIGKDPDTGKGRRKRGCQRMRWWMASPSRWAWVWASSGSWWWTGKPGVLQSMGSRWDMTEPLSWTEDSKSSKRPKFILVFLLCELLILCQMHYCTLKSFSKNLKFFVYFMLIKVKRRCYFCFFALMMFSGIKFYEDL